MVLSQASREYRSLVDNSCDVYEDGYNNDLNDVFLEASKIIGELVKEKKISDIKPNALRLASDIETEFLNKERIFIKSMESEMDIVSLKAEDFKSQVNELMIQFKNYINDLNPLINDAKKHVKDKEEQVFQEFLNYHQEEMRKIVEKENELMLVIKEKHKKSLDEYSNQWSMSIREADEQIEKAQKKLQGLIHEKQQIVQHNHEEISIKEKQIADEESILISEYDTQLENERQKILNFEHELDIHRKSCDEWKNKLKNVQIECETEINKERTTIEKRNNDEISIISSEYNTYFENLSRLNHALERIKVDVMIKKRDIERMSQTKYMNEQSQIEELSKDEINELDSYYGPLIASISKSIQEAQSRRSLSIEELQKASVNPVEFCELEIMEINKQFQEKRADLMAKLRNAKNELQNSLLLRGESIDQLKLVLDASLNSLVELYEKNENENQDQILKLISTFDEEKKKIALKLKEESDAFLEKRNHLLEKLKEDHEQRKRDIVQKAEMLFKIESEKAYTNGVQDATQQHNQEMEALKERIQDIQNSYDLNQSNFSTFEEYCKTEIEDYSNAHRKEMTKRKHEIGVSFQKKQKEIKKKIEEEQNQCQLLTNELTKVHEHNIELSKVSTMTIEEFEEFYDQEYYTKKSALKAELAEKEEQLSRIRLSTIKKDKIKSELIQESNVADKDLIEYDLTYEQNHQYLLSKYQEEMSAKISELNISLINLEIMEREQIKKLEFDYNQAKNQYMDSIESLNSIKSKNSKDKDKLLKELENSLESKNNIRINEEEKLFLLSLSQIELKMKIVQEEKFEKVFAIRKEHANDKNVLDAQLMVNTSSIDQEIGIAKENIDQIRKQIESYVPNQCNSCLKKKDQIKRFIQKKEELQNTYDDAIKSGVVSDEKLTKVFNKVVRPISKLQTTIKSPKGKTKPTSRQTIITPR